MKKRIKWLLLAALMLPAAAQAAKPQKSKIGELKGEKKIWIWMNPSNDRPDSYYDSLFSLWARYRVSGVFFESDVEKAFRIAKKHKLEAHRWIWTVNRGDLVMQHPEYAAVSRSGKNTHDNPPYVGYYRWICPSNPDAVAALKKEVTELCSKSYIDGIHLDYVRFCDVVLPVSLWSNYGIVQQQELPEYDFCYCDRCRSLYKEEYGVDPLDVKYPDQLVSWREFRYRQVVAIVKELAAIAHQQGKPISAAVFPTPEVARRLVRQDWVRFPIDAVCPMVYNSFYNEPPLWIRSAVREGTDFLDGKKPLYAGLFLSGFKSVDELKLGVRMALEGGASGVSLFSVPSEVELKAVSETIFGAAR